MKKNNIDVEIARLNKKYGEGTICRASAAKGLHVQRFSTGSLVLDVALGGGYAEGRWNELVGPFSSYKTTDAQIAAGEFQAKYPDTGEVVYVDNEAPSFSAEYAERCGMDLDRTQLVQTESGEEAGDIVYERMASLKSGVQLLVIVDSIAAMLPMKELESDMGDSTPAAHSRLIAKFVRRVKSQMKSDFLTNSPTRTILALNQRRAKFNSMPWADNETTTGGNCLEHATDLRIKFKKGEPISKETTISGVKLKKTYGHKVNFLIQKNKTGMTLFDKGMFTYYTRRFEGFPACHMDNAGDILPIAQAYGVIVVSGDKFKMDGCTYNISGLNNDRWLQREIVRLIVGEDDTSVALPSKKKPAFAL